MKRYYKEGIQEAASQSQWGCIATDKLPLRIGIIGLSVSALKADDYYTAGNLEDLSCLVHAYWKLKMGLWNMRKLCLYIYINIYIY